MSEDGLAGYILARAGAGDVHWVRKKLRAVCGVSIAHALIGPDDLICYIERSGKLDFQDALDTGIRQLINDGLLTSTETLLILGHAAYSFFGLGQRAQTAAWLFLELNIGNPEPVATALRRIKGIVNANPVVGRYDMVAYAEAGSLKELMTILDRDVRNVPGINRTDTRLVLM